MTRMAAAVAALCLAAAAPADAAMVLTSSDFKSGTTMPAAQIYPRCGGQNISPALSWRGTPAGTKSLVLTLIDESVKPDGWSHWIVVDLPPGTTALARGTKTLPGAAHAVAGNFGDAFYDGPCPPAGSGPHRYVFTIWAMPQATTAIAPDAKAFEVEAMLKKTAIASATTDAFVTR